METLTAAFSSPQALAALVAALMSTIGFVVAIWSLTRQHTVQRELAELGHFAEDNKQVRAELRDVVELVERALTSLNRLMMLSAALGDDAMVVETSHSLAIVSDLLNKTASSRVIVYPDEVAHSIATLRSAVTSFLLELSFSLDERSAPEAKAKLARKFKDIEATANTVVSAIKTNIAPN